MAKNREPEKLVQSDSESGEEEDSSSEETSSQESDSEPELTQFTKKPSSSTPVAAKKPLPQSASKPQQRPPSSLPVEEESESESQSDSDGPDPKLRSIATTPMNDAQKSTNGARKSRSKPSAADLATPNKSTAVKRPTEEKEAEAKDAKKSKKKAEPETSEKKPTDDPKKALFQRLWSEEDEIVILKGLIDYSIKKKTDPAAELNAFHDFIKKNLHIDVTKTQLQDKIRKLKKKYENNKSKEEKDGKERTFPKPHEQKVYELSKSVWGNENVKENGVERVVGSPNASSTALRKAAAIKKAYAAKKSANVADNEEPKDAKAVDADNESVLQSKRAKLIGATVEESILMIGAELFENGKGGEGQNEWNNLRIEEMEVYRRNLEVKSAQARIVIKRLKSEGN